MFNAVGCRKNSHESPAMEAFNQSLSIILVTDIDTLPILYKIDAL